MSMMNRSNPDRYDYFEVNSYPLATLISNFEERLNSDPGVQIVHINDEQAELITGIFSTENLDVDSYEKIDDMLRDLQYMSESVKAEAINSYIGAKAMMEMLRISDSHTNELGIYEQKSTTPSYRFLSNDGFEFAKTIHHTEDEYILTISRSLLKNVEGYGDMFTYKLVAEDEYIEEHLTVCMWNDKVHFITNQVAPIEDELMQRVWACFIDNDQVTRTLMNILLSEENPEIDAVLNEIWLEYQGTHKEEEVGPLLEEFRLRVIAIYESHIFSAEHDTGMPSNEKLHFFLSLLEK
jgi:hypothetical protein